MTLDLDALETAVKAMVPAPWEVGTRLAYLIGPSQEVDRYDSPYFEHHADAAGIVALRNNAEAFDPQRAINRGRS